MKKYLSLLAVLALLCNEDSRCSRRADRLEHAAQLLGQRELRFGGERAQWKPTDRHAGDNERDDNHNAWAVPNVVAVMRADQASR